MISMRTVLITATIALGLTLSATAQTLAPGTESGACLKDFAPLRAEAEKHAKAIKAGMEQKLPREEICGLFKQFSAAEGRVVKFIVDNSRSCGIPAGAEVQMKANHGRTLRTTKQVCGGDWKNPDELPRRQRMANR